MTTRSDKHDDLCCICGCRIDGYPNEAWPVEEGKCCPACNWSVVLPVRIRLSKRPIDDNLASDNDQDMTETTTENVSK